MSIFDAGERMQLEAFNYASDTIVYLSGGTTIAAGIPAKVGSSVFRYTDRYGNTIREVSKDFTLRTQDLMCEPNVGDEIRHGDNVYVVASFNGEPCWRWHSANSKLQIRIHAKEAGVMEVGNE